MTMEQLKQYNGLGPDGRVLVAVNGKIFDVTKGNIINKRISVKPFPLNCHKAKNSDNIYECRVFLKLIVQNQCTQNQNLSNSHHFTLNLTTGKRFYGPGGPYAAFAGRDASRGLAKFSVAASDDFDDLSDLNDVEKESVKEWETQFTGN